MKRNIIIALILCALNVFCFASCSPKEDMTASTEISSEAAVTTLAPPAISIAPASIEPVAEAISTFTQTAATQTPPQATSSPTTKDRASMTVEDQTSQINPENEIATKIDTRSAEREIDEINAFIAAAD